MQFHHHGYVSTDPRVLPAAGTGIDRPADLPDEVDVLIVGTGPAGMLLAAQLAQFPSITTRIIERRTNRLAIGHADGIQARSVETFQAFGFAERITQEAYEITAMNFWAPDPDNINNIIRTQRTDDATPQFSEFPHLIVNQARVLDYFAEVARSSSTRLEPDFGWEFVGLTIDDSHSHPVHVSLRRTHGEFDQDTGTFIDLDPTADISTAPEEQLRMLRAQYVVGCDGARSRVRAAIDRHMTGDQAMHAWAVMDVLVETDFPDIRTKCAIQSEHGSILHIPREGGHLFRMYVDLGELTEASERSVRTTTVEEAIATANKILHPYSLDVRHVAWYSVYEVGHRVTDKFDDVPFDNEHHQFPRVFVAGDACHTHSAKAGQGMNVSMQDTFNLGWKLAAVLEGRSAPSLLATYSAERQKIAQDLIDFDKEWSALMAKKPEEFSSPEELGDFYLRTFEFPTGFMTQYPPSAITGDQTHQDLATGYPVGKRFRSEIVTRVCDVKTLHLGHHARADGRWRLYAFADSDRSELRAWADFMSSDAASPWQRFTPVDGDPDSVFDIKVIYQQPYDEVELADVPQLFFPKVGPYRLIDYEKVYSRAAQVDIFQTRGISRDGVLIAVRPDQYVALVLPLADTATLADFFAGFMVTPAVVR